MRNVIRGFGHGVVTVGDGPIAPVNFIVFEVAQGDVREHLDGLAAFDEAWALRVLHNIASGLNQLHGADIFHQDLKPSNVLMFPQATKLGDLGRAQGGALPSPHSDIHGPGDLYYSPPECWYGFTQGDALARSRAIDIYHLGSMIMFMFTRVSVTAALASHMDEQLYPQNWAGTFDQVLPHLRDGFDQVALDLESQLPDWLKTGLVELVRQLCDPDPRLRGRSKMSVGSAVRMSVEYYVSRLDFLSRKAEVELRKALS
jgi:serine/threonine protein kinase